MSAKKGIEAASPREQGLALAAVFAFCVGVTYFAVNGFIVGELPMVGRQTDGELVYRLHNPQAFNLLVIEWGLLVAGIWSILIMGLIKVVRSRSSARRNAGKNLEP